MAFEDLNFEDVGPRFIKAKEFAKGDVLVTGTFGGKVPGYMNSTDNPSYVFTEDNGSTVTIYGFGSMHKSMQGVQEGMICRVIHDGTFELTKGKNKGTTCQAVRVQTAGYKDQAKPVTPVKPVNLDDDFFL